MKFSIRETIFGKATVNNVTFLNRLSGTFLYKFVNVIKYPISYLWYLLPLRLRQKIFLKLTQGNVNTNKLDDDFSSIYFELRTRCNSQCSFCSASIQNETRPDINMPLALYKKIIDELEEKKFSKLIGFYVNNEPLLVKDIDKYISYAHKKLPSARLRVLTNGRKLNDKNGKMLLDAGINDLEVNVYVSSINDKIPAGIEKFENEIILPFLNNKKEIHSREIIFTYNGRRIKYHKVLRQINETLTSRGGSAPNWEDTGITFDGFCSFPFWQLNITANGNVGQCCADFSFDSTELNCRTQNIYSIWHSSFFKNLRSELIDGNRSNNKICSKCDYVGENGRNVNSYIGKLFIGLINNT